MTSICKHTMSAVAAALCAATAPVHAAPEAQEIYNLLVQQEAPAPVQTAQREAIIPALAMLPGQADAVFVAAQAGASINMIMQLLDCKCPEGEAQLGSIGSMAICAGGGSTAAFQRALPAMVYASQLSSIHEWEKRWSEHAKPEFTEAIHQAFRQQAKLLERSLKDTLADYHPKPLYAAFTAEPGREVEFQNLCRSIQQCMLRATQESGWKLVEQQGFTAGISTSQLHMCKLLFGAEPENDALRQDLAARQVNLLMKVQENKLLLVLCEQPGDIALPQEPGSSLLGTPMLAKADAHMSQLRAAAYVSPEFFQTLQSALYVQRASLTYALVSALHNISQLDPARQGAYMDASRDALLLDSQPLSSAPTISRPLSMVIWQPQSNLLRAQTTMDAWGARFEPGELRLASRATTPDTIYYAEGTSFTSPYLPHTEHWQRAFLSIGQALMLTLREDSKDSLIPWIRSAKALAPDAQALEAALRTMGDAVSSPFALVSASGAEGEDPAVAICAAVTSRAGLADGWQQLLNSLGQIAGKFGLTPDMVTELPIESKQLSDNAISHSLNLPFLPKDMHPGVALNSSYIVLGYSEALNERLLKAAADPAGRMPFCGAVCSISFPGWAKTARTMTERSGNTQGSAMCITRFLERLAARATLYMHATTIQDGAVSTGSWIKLR